MTPSNNLFASIDMGTNSFKMLIIQTDKTGKFLTIDRHKDPVCLGRGFSSSISKESLFRAVTCLKRFNQVLKANKIPPPTGNMCLPLLLYVKQVMFLTSKDQFLNQLALKFLFCLVKRRQGFVYLGVLQFLPVFDKRVLVIDIGGGSTEFCDWGKRECCFGGVFEVGSCGFDSKVWWFRGFVGTSGTVRAIERAVFNGYGKEFVEGNEVLLRDCKREWKFSRGELSGVVERVCREGEEERVKRDGFFKRRSEFIVAGSVLLEEIFEAVGIEEMEVSEYALGEGVIAETLSKVFEGYDLNANARWHSAVRLATRFSGKKGIKSAAQCSSIAKNGNHLQGYSAEEVKLIALLTRHHRKKFPKFDGGSLQEFAEELKQKFRVLCAIVRLSVVLQQSDGLNFQDMEFLHSQEGFKLIFREAGAIASFPLPEDMGKELRNELENFKIQHGLKIHLENDKRVSSLFQTRIIGICFDMGIEEGVVELHDDKGKIDKKLTISVHTFSDLTYTSPVVFLYLLKECYAHGTCKATNKFRILQQKVYHALENSPQPGPATFVVWCLYVLPIFGLHCEGFSHLIISALRRFLNLAPTLEDTSKAKVIAARLFLDIVGGLVDHDERIVVKILEVFDVKLADVDKALCQLNVQDDYKPDTAKTLVEDYIFKLIDSQSYMTAASLLEHFSIRQSGKSFLVKMMQNKQSRAAEKWATFMGKSMLCALVQDLLKKLAEKALWDLAEAKTHGDKQLLEYLVYLAMEAGYSEKVDELCERYSLEGFLNVKESEGSVLQSKYLHLDELAVENIIWVDEVDGLCAATSHIEGCKVVGLDCEWKPNYVKGSKPNKVSIMQIASDKTVFIFDLIKLFEDIPDILDNCLSRILQSPRILKLGYNFQCDIKQLAHSYGELRCFNNYEKLLDMQNVFKETRGGLSGLAEKILGTGLNKTRRNSNWELRPLSHNQLEYAALDAAVLVHIFHHFHNHSQSAGFPDGHDKIEWKSHIVSRMDNPKKAKKESKNKRELEDDINKHGQSN
ncbi:hypothetical protein NC652_012514 [Populus alba x Populus x berolinensis]|nr:hypothetical protein NC652_012514 [Populus alba x Populus x berolinensis]